jgi:hypothetical protein
MAANSGSSDITVFSISDGALTPLGALMPIVGSPFTTGSPPHGIKISPDGKFLAAALNFSNAMAMFSIASEGTLTPAPDSPFPGASVGALAGVDINCASSLLFGGSSADTTTVNVFAIATNGALTALLGSPFTPGVGANSTIVLLSPSESLLFVSNQGSSSVTAFSVDSKGTLSLVVGSPFAAPVSTFPSGMATDQAGNFLYVANGNNTNAINGSSIYGYSVANNGALTPVPGSPFTTNQPGLLLSLTAFPGKTCNRPPDCSTAIASPSMVWPPTQQMVSISLSGVSDPDGDPVTITPKGVSQNKGAGDATLSPLAVRADRYGTSDDRVYTIEFTASDGRGGTCTGAVNVCVPHDQGSKPSGCQ